MASLARNAKIAEKASKWVRPSYPQPRSMFFVLFCFLFLFCSLNEIVKKSEEIWHGRWAKKLGVTYWHFGNFPIFGPGIEQLCFEVDLQQPCCTSSNSIAPVMTFLPLQWLHCTSDGSVAPPMTLLPSDDLLNIWDMYDRSMWTIYSTTYLC